MSGGGSNHEKLILAHPSNGEALSDNVSRRASRSCPVGRGSLTLCLVLTSCGIFYYFFFAQLYSFLLLVGLDISYYVH